MSLYRIQEALFNKPWLVKPSFHQSMVRQFLSHINAGSMPDINVNEMPDVNNALTNNDGSPIAVIPVDGIIGKHLSMLETACGGCDVDEIKDQLQAAASDPSVSKIVLYFNTPGGTVTGVAELAELITEINAQKQCVAYTDTLCASAGYWLMSQCSLAYAAPSAEVGSIGVYSLYLDETRALEQEGVKVNAISAGKYKLTGAPFKPMTDEEKAMLQADVDKVYARFKSAVTTNRNIADADMQGQCFDGETAVTKGFLDGNINSIQELLAFLES